MENEGDLVTLNEALAFIDSLDVTEFYDSSSSSTEDNDNDTTSTFDAKIPKGQVTKRKRNRSNLSSSTRLQQSRRAELLYLRKYVQELEEKKVKLETWDKGFCQAEMEAAEGSVWMNLAKTHFQARLRSEMANRTLKTMLTNQTQVIDLLQNIVHKQAFVLEMDQAGVVEESHPSRSYQDHEGEVYDEFGKLIDDGDGQEAKCLNNPREAFLVGDDVIARMSIIIKKSNADAGVVEVAKVKKGAQKNGSVTDGHHAAVKISDCEVRKVSKTQLTGEGEVLER